MVANPRDRDLAGDRLPELFVRRLELFICRLEFVDERAHRLIG
jgi:hypothetical protein